MPKQPLTILGYELVTPKFTGDSYNFERFDFEMFKYFFGRILTDVNQRERAFKTKTKMVNLMSFNQSSEDAEIWEGQFITARYGKERTIYNVPDQTDQGVLDKKLGAKNYVYFTVHTKTGLLLLEKDSERVLGRDMITRFIRYHKDQIIPYLTKFNKTHSPFKIHKPNFLKINSLPKKTFWEDIKAFRKINEAYFYLDIDSTKNKSNSASNFLYLHNEAAQTTESNYSEYNDLVDIGQRAESEGLRNTTRVKISFESKMNPLGIYGVQDYFKKLFDSQVFDGFGVNGTLTSGRSRTIELENIQRAFDVQCEFNENGLPSLHDMYNEMSQIIKADNPIIHKEEIVQFEGVEFNEEEREV